MNNSSILQQVITQVPLLLVQDNMSNNRVHPHVCLLSGLATGNEDYGACWPGPGISPTVFVRVCPFNRVYLSWCCMSWTCLQFGLKRSWPGSLSHSSWWISHMDMPCTKTTRAGTRRAVIVSLASICCRCCCLLSAQ